jgi:hypothetical protein
MSVSSVKGKLIIINGSILSRALVYGFNLNSAIGFFIYSNSIKNIFDNRRYFRLNVYNLTHKIFPEDFLFKHLVSSVYG